MTEFYPTSDGHPTPSPLEEALADKLTQLVAAGQLTEGQAMGIMPGYEYPELLLWIRPPADRLQPPPLDSVLTMAERLRTEQAQQRVADAQARYWATRTDADAVTRTYHREADADGDDWGA